MTMIVYGPMACGKTRNAQALAAHFGLKVIIDDWDPTRHVLTDGALHLTNAPCEGYNAPKAEFRTIRFNPNSCNGARRLPPQWKPQGSKTRRKGGAA